MLSTEKNENFDPLNYVKENQKIQEFGNLTMGVTEKDKYLSETKKQFSVNRKFAENL